MSTKTTSTKIVVFNGKPTKFKVWAAKFLGRAASRGYKTLLTGAVDVPTAAEYEAALRIDADDRDDADKATIKNFERATEAYGDLIQAMDDDTPEGLLAFETIDNAITAENPDGDCKLAWDRLDAKYRPKTALRYSQLDVKLNKLTLQDASGDPDVLLTQALALKAAMNKIQMPGKSERTDVDIILHVLGLLPKDYSGVAREVENALSDGDTEVTVEWVREKLSAEHARVTKGVGTGRGLQGEAALAAFADAIMQMDADEVAHFVKQFKGNCNKCGKYGHKGADCGKNKGSGSGKSGGSGPQGFRGSCYHCGERGHMKRDCDKRQKPPSELANVAMQTYEIVGWADSPEPGADLGQDSSSELCFGVMDGLSPQSEWFDVLPSGTRVSGTGNAEVHQDGPVQGLDAMDWEGTGGASSFGAGSPRPKQVSFSPKIRVRYYDARSGLVSALGPLTTVREEEVEAEWVSWANVEEEIDFRPRKRRRIKDDFPGVNVMSIVRCQEHSAALAGRDELPFSSIDDILDLCADGPGKTPYALWDEPGHPEYRGGIFDCPYIPREDILYDTDCLDEYQMPTEEDIQRRRKLLDDALRAISSDDQDMIDMFGDGGMPGYVRQMSELTFYADPDDADALEHALSTIQIGGHTYLPFNDRTSVGDSGDTCHMFGTAYAPYLYDKSIVHQTVTTFDGKPTDCEGYVGKLDVLFLQTDGSSAMRTLDKAICSPAIKQNLFSFTQENVDHGAKVNQDNDRNDYVLTYPDGGRVAFDRRHKTRTGWVGGVDIIPLRPMLPRTFAESANLARVEEEGGTADANGKGREARDGVTHQRGATPSDTYHKQLGHPDMKTTQSTARARHEQLSGPTVDVCESCVMGKTRQRGVPKARLPRAEKPGDRIFLDISSPTPASIGGNKHWALVLDDASDMCFSFFMKHKDELKDHLVPFIKNLQAKNGIRVRRIRMDNAGENLALQQALDQEGLGITYEYTAPGTPMQNGRVERRYQTYYGRIRAMLYPVELDGKERLWCEAANTATDLDGILVRQGDSLSPFQRFFGKGSRTHVDGSKIFGEKCVVADRSKIKAKLDLRGKHCLWLGYAKDHPVGTYRVFNPTTRRVSLSRDVVFLRKMGSTDAQKQALQRLPPVRATAAELKDSATSADHAMSPALVSDGEDDDSDDSDEEAEEDDAPPPLAAPVAAAPFNHGQPLISDDESGASSQYQSADDGPETAEDDATEATASTSQLARDASVVREMRRLQSSFNERASRIVEESQRQDDANSANDEVSRDQDGSLETGEGSESDSGTELSHILLEMDGYAAELEEYAYAAAEAEGNVPDFKSFVEPTTFEQAWNHPDPYQRRKWREAVAKEYTDMRKRTVWEVMLRSAIPANRRCVKCKWVFKIKRDGRFRARLVACGYSQIPGVDFSENYSPVVNDATLRILYVMMLVMGFIGIVVDVETAFLYGNLEEEIFMECPPGMTGVTSANCLRLLKCIYGLVQAARQYYKHATAVLRKIGFTGADVDPCLLWKRSKLGVCYVCMYIDDNLLIGDRAAVEDTIAQMRRHGLILKVEGSLRDYLSCELVFKDGRRRAWMGQPHLYDSLEKAFGDEVKGLRTYITPGTPGLSMVREMDETKRLPAELASRYRSGVGMLLYLVKNTRPDIANCVRELSKVLDGSTRASYKEMLRIIKFVLDTRDYGLAMRPQKIQGEGWSIVCYTDSDYATDPDSRRSVSGYVIYVQGVPVIWRSRAQRSVTLSSTEAEWVSLSEAVKDVVFVMRLLKSMGIRIRFPIIVRVDNVGAMFMAQNVTTTGRTKHVQTRGRYVFELNEAGIIKLVFVKSEDNLADIMTKNLGHELYSKHSRMMIERR